MDDLEILRERIPGYAGYDRPGSRHETDKQIRAYLGEALSEARERLTPAPPLSDGVDALILRCEFTDQAFIRAADRARFEPALVGRVTGFDGALADCADRIRGVGAADDLAPLVDEAARTLDERAAVVEGL